MRLSSGCRECMRRREHERTDDPAYLAAVDEILENEGAVFPAPYLAWLFSEKFRIMVREPEDYTLEKKQYNDLVLSMRKELRKEIEQADDPFRRSLEYSRIGNYIDFSALPDVEEKTFLSLFGKSALRPEELPVYEQFRRECREAKTFLLVADNCGEIVLDMLFLEQLKKLNPNIAAAVMVRGGMTVNDVTEEDAAYVGLTDIARVLAGPHAAPGLIVEHLESEAKEAFWNAEVVLSKGQGNYEGISGCLRPVYFMFLCKCDMFAERFGVRKLTGILRKETGGVRDL